MAESLLFFGGTIVTCDDSTPGADSVLVTDGRIAAMGTEPWLRSVAHAHDVVEIDLAGAALLPGFIDAHHHFLWAALDRRGPNLRALPPNTGIDEVLAAVATQAAETPGDGWVRLFGYSPITLRERRHPTRRELDAACPDRPLLVAAHGWHSGALNSAAFDAMGWLPPVRPPQHGRIPLERNGLPRGEVFEAALYLAEAASRGSLTVDAVEAWLAEAHAHALDLAAAGITRIGDAAVAPEFDALYERAVAADLLPITVHRMPIGGRTLLQPRTSGPATGSGPARSPVGAAKLFLDGGESCAVCLSVGDLVRVARAVLGRAVSGAGLAAIRAVTQGESVRPGLDLRFHRGTLFWEQPRLEATIADAAEHGLQVAQHAFGNEAIEQACRALDRVRARLDPLPGRPRLEHTVFCEPPLAARIADLGAIAVVSPIWLDDLSAAFEPVPPLPNLGPIPLRTLTAAGVTLAGCSDYPSAGYQVLPALQAAATRRAADGTVHAPGEAITVTQALRAYTMGSAAALGVADIAGSLTVGKTADLVVLDRDPLTTHPAELSRIQVLRTFVGGTQVYSPE
ncbi:amidohydrolase [Nocardia pseudobrasiliensis]|uniref:Amidohydrolase 3 domain-containing protein n=1 Tax=Nocardia pseudobrasiliensis TaxID=45979 RepID=A0A370IA69_9NOCA|nr:amidohydrolase family protein [Nocardia pseudobrasiliensis]RDI67607.1 hypothetical protein DFR76_1024 [Nocardia pseudobrasiliensis]